MKTIYTLLLACGLCFTSHAQDLQILSDVSNAQLSETELTEFKNIAFGADPTLILNTTSTEIYNNGTPIKRIVLSNPNGVSLLNATTSLLNQVKVLEIKWEVSNTYVFNAQLTTKLSALKYIYVTSYEMLNESSVQNIVGTLKVQFPNAKIVFQTLKDS